MKKKIRKANPLAMPPFTVATAKFNYQEHLLSNVAAISADLHTHKLYDRFYKECGSKLGGFTGIYDYVISLANALTEHEAATPDIWEGDHGDWVETVEAIVQRVLERSIQDGEVLPLDSTKAYLRTFV